MLTAYWPAVRNPGKKLDLFSVSEQLIDEADLRYTIILDRGGRVMDGMHRICKSVREGKDKVLAVRFAASPEADFVGCDPNELPYDD